MIISATNHLKTRGSMNMTMVERQEMIISNLIEDRNYYIEQIQFFINILKEEPDPPENDFQRGFDAACRYVLGKLYDILDK
jgi:hypothetical protein